MNMWHEILNAVLPFDFADPDVRRIALRATPFTAASVFFTLSLLTILVRSIRGRKDGYVLSEVIVKVGLIAYLIALAANYWLWWQGDDLFFDIVRSWMGAGALIGIPIMTWFLIVAIRDEWRYWRQRWKERRQRDDHDDRDVPGFP